MMCLLNRMLAIVAAVTPIAMTISLVSTSVVPRDQRAGLCDNESVDRLLYGIVQNDSAQLDRVLVHANVNVNERDRLGVTPLIVAIIGPRASSQMSMTLLICAGADVNLADSAGLTPLMHAVIAHNDEAVQILLDGGAELGARDHQSETALEMARVNENTFAEQLLSVEGLASRAIEAQVTR